MNTATKYIEKTAEKKVIKNSKAIIDYTLEGFKVATQTHIYHLLTKSYAQHMAIGEFYDSIQSCIDAIAEKSIGLGLVADGSMHPTELVFAFDDAALIALAKQFREKTITLIGLTSDNSVLSINDDLINIQAAIDNLLYKLQLK